MSKLNNLLSKYDTPKKELSLLKLLVMNASDGVHILTQNGDVVYCSTTFADLLGYSLEEAHELNVKDWDRHFPVEDMIPVIKDLIENPKIFETKHEKKNGEIFNVEINARGIELDGDFFLYASSRDITGVKKEAMVNRKNHAKLQSIFRTTPDAFFVIDSSGRIESVNDKLIKLFGLSEKELLGTNIDKYLKVDVTKLVGETEELEFTSKDGRVVPISINVGEARTEDGLYLTGIIRDISEQKKYQRELEDSRNKALAAEKAKSLFLANMSHEIRTPMNGILGMASLLKDTSLNPLQEEMLSIINSCGDSLLTIINDILSFSKIESGKLSIEKVSFNLKKSVEDVTSLIANIASEKGITIHSKIDNSIPQFLKSDIVRLKQIITNLLSNAVKFSPDEEKVFLDIKLTGCNGNIVKVLFSVKDNGIGMSEEEQSRLFQEFTQADEGVTRKFGGTGLGLSISSKLAKLLGGKIKVESRKGEGSKFSFELEFEKGNEFQSEEQDVNYDGFEKKYPHKIILVEDNRVNQKLGEMILAKLGYKVDIVENGKVAVEACSNENYSLIFMDMQMPVMDGVTATKKILKNNKESKIVAMTANVLEEDRQKCLDAGMLDFVSKPVRIANVASVIKSLSD
ncbi:putative histidine kinase/response regulator fusion protein [Halobacteriovorax marinus SJ]|uniref:Sensory/regulatory protein RpfC n=1 Tax=Halobacteriovorax marinus (strain ATCC BAA-682 / DSM 15412 / SJ) TaxID=862908 RepID=E1X5G6_HALMS|nr:PAS domain S-box protein [Halobacteriovorax marinus]CBW27287.1 putative histidine kinase/response regulator fusion protein [Halobacteriovorax marinus SJ]